MPFRSDAQRRWAHTAAGIAALGGPKKVSEWDSASKGLKLPKRINPTVSKELRASRVDYQKAPSFGKIRKLMK